MVALRGSTAGYQIARTVLTAVSAQLNSTPAGTPGRVCLVPGAIAWDECECNGGQLAIAGSRIFMTDSFPNQNIKPQWNNAAAYIDNEFIIQIIRCAPNMSDGGAPPTCIDLEASAQVVLTDAYEVMCATASTLASMANVDTIDDYLIYDQVFVGPEGGCVGSELRFVTQVLR